MYCLWSLPLTTFITSIPLSLLFCFVFVICVFLWPFTELWRVHFIMIISTRHVFPGPGISCRDLLSDLLYEMDQCLQVKRQNLSWLGWLLQMGRLEDLLTTEKLYTLYLNLSLFISHSHLNQLVLGQYAIWWGSLAILPACGYGAILKGAAAHTPGLPAASLVCLTFCQHHVNEGPVSVHRSHTGAPFNEFAIWSL